MRVVRDPGDVDESLRAYHTDLVAAIAERMGVGSVGRAVELGSGTGLFTMPLLEALGDGLEVLSSVDPFPGPYSGSRSVLQSRLESLELGGGGTSTWTWSELDLPLHPAVMDISTVPENDILTTRQ